MCYSVAGRIQTRLCALSIPALLAAVMIWLAGDQRYFTMLIVMVLVALDLDRFLYTRVFTYQPAWQTYLLGALEFAVLLSVVRVLDGTLPLPEIVLYYVISWLGGLLVTNVVLPVLDPLWREHGGEIARRWLDQLAGQGLAGDRLSGWRRLIRDRTGDLLTLAALVFFCALTQTVLPTALQWPQILASVIGALLVGLAAQRLRRDSLGAIDALILGCTVPLLIRGPSVVPFLLAGGIAVACRALLTVAGRPVVSSGACALVLAVLLIPGVYAADGQWGNSLLLPLVTVNAAVLIGLLTRRAPLVLAYLGVVVLHGLVAVPVSQDAFQILLPQLLPAPLLFFAGFVLPERDVSPTSRPAQLILGVGAGAAGILLQAVGVALPYAFGVLAVSYLVNVLPAIVAPLRRDGPRAAPDTNGRKGGASRRAFLAAVAAAVGGLALGGMVRRLAAIDPAIAALPPEPVLAGGHAIPRFVDVAARAGIALSHHGDPAEGNPAVGTGVTWGDFDNDGHLDLYVTDHMGPNHLYRNNGDGTFSDIAEQAGVAEPAIHATSAVFVDYDNDGWLDLYVGVSHGPNVLYRNNRNGTFTDVTVAAGLGDPGRTMSTAWADYNGDGYLDVFVVNYPDEPVTFNVDSTPSENARAVTHMPRPYNRLYRNNGNGTFSDVTELLGLDATRGFGFSATWFDYNQDGRPDLYVAYDFGWVQQHNTLWRNDGPGGPLGWQFTQVEERAGVAAGINAMGAASGDYDNDGWLDIAVSNIGPNLLYQNADGVAFHSIGSRAGVTHSVDRVENMLNPSMTWGLDFADFNNDGWLDLYLVAGAMDFEHVPQPNVLYMNDHRGRFLDVSAASGANDPGQGRSVAVGDYDGDGYLDMFVANYGQPPRLYRNLSRRSGNHWIRLELEGTRSNRQAVGARVVLHAPGLPPQTREVQIGQGLGSSDATALHFGLGTTSLVERIEIRWPSGTVQRLRGGAADRVLKIREPGPSRWPERET